MSSFLPTVLLDQGDHLNISATAKHALGTRGVTVDGRVFRYSRAGEALAAGRLAFAKAPTELQFGTNCPLTTDQAAGIAVSSTSLKLSSTWSAFSGETGTTGIVADYFKEGYFVVSGTTGGQIVRIKGNSTASTGTASQNIEVYFEYNDKLAAALTTANEVFLAHNQYDRITMNLGQAIAGETSIPVGVTPKAVTSLYYFWLQTWGPVPVFCGTATTLGLMATGSTEAATTGGVSLYALNASATGLDLLGAIRRPPIGNVLVAGAALEYSLIDLHISP
ncbi:hypothetical protein KKH13_04460 [Patescibacteria group bacterium]|uniref:Uncharacterized protein n=1 Tax=viral metagenome TaxID=1070528 RepID=A0A6M3KWD4_9ZZZZ|nr:hypothetical protein [Patescibacteria group bacterium]